MSCTKVCLVLMIATLVQNHCQIEYCIYICYWVYFYFLIAPAPAKPINP